MIAVVEIGDESPGEPRSVIGRDGRPFRFWPQRMYLDLGEKYPADFEFLLDLERGPYAAGKYVFGSRSFARDRKSGSLIFSRTLELIPVSEAAGQLRDVVGSIKSPRPAAVAG